jgi:hypothetical protein
MPQQASHTIVYRPQSHAFGEWFLVQEGELTLREECDGTVIYTATLGASDSAWIGAGVVYGTLNLSAALTRFQVIGQPGAMTGYFALPECASPTLMLRL